MNMQFVELALETASILEMVDSLENEIAVECAFETMLLGDDSIALEANIIQKIKSGIAKIKKDDKNEGQKELKEASDELAEAEKDAESSNDEEQKKKLSKVAKVGIGLATAALLGTAAYAAIKHGKGDPKSKNASVDELNRTADEMNQNKNPSANDLKKAFGVLVRTKAEVPSNADSDKAAELLDKMGSSIKRCKLLKNRHDDMTERLKEAKKSGNSEAITSITRELDNISVLYERIYSNRIASVVDKLNADDKSSVMSRVNLPANLK